jgi:hypothetical protein
MTSITFYFYFWTFSLFRLAFGLIQGQIKNLVMEPEMG